MLRTLCAHPKPIVGFRSGAKELADPTYTKAPSEPLGSHSCCSRTASSRREPERAGGVNREQLAEIDLHWHDLRHEAACRWLSRGLDMRAIQLLLGHADLKTTQRYLNVTDEELRKTMQQKLWSRKS